MQKSKLWLVLGYLAFLVVGMTSVSSQAVTITSYETGFDLNNDGILDVVFSEDYSLLLPPQSPVFLGFTTDTPISTIDIHFGGRMQNESGTLYDNVAIDDLRYPFAGVAPVPEPASLALLAVGIAGLGFARCKSLT